MADEETKRLEHAEERCTLLKTLKHAVETLLPSYSSDNLDARDGLEEMINDLLRIIGHGKREKQVNCEMDKENINSLPENTTFIEDSDKCLHQALQDHSLSLYVSELVNKRKEILYWYQEFAFLRSVPHTEAMCVCVEAFERRDRELLSQIDNVLLNKEKYVEQCLKVGEDLSLQNDSQGTDLNESPSQIQIVYSDSGSSELEEFVSSYNRDSPGDEAQIYITDIPLPCNVEGVNEDDSQLYSTDLDHNFSFLPNTGTSLISEDMGRHAYHNMDRVGERNILPSGILRTTMPSRTGHNVKATLAHAALSAVLESEELTASPASWFDEQSEDKGHKLRKASSTGSLNDSSFHDKNDTVDGKSRLETKDFKPATPNNSIDGLTSELNSRQRLGHSRSRSDQIGVPKAQEKTFIVKKPKTSDQRQQKALSAVKQLSSSLPANSEPLYSSDPFSEDPYEEQSLAEMLASQDFSSCEMDKENAHFSISEALIAAIEQMKCDDVNTSEEDDDDDEEIRSLKEQLERKRQEKKQGRNHRYQSAFSDGTTHSTTSGPSTATTSSKSLCETEDELSHDWEDLSPTDEQVQELNNDLHATTSKFVSSTEIKPSLQLSAEAVAKSLLQKFGNTSHPAACELQWLVSFQDAPQSLLPLPQTVAVAPDDVPQVDAMRRHAVSRQNSLPCRIRGNSEWAPPRAQIIFHAHKPPRRKVVMAKQNFRCAGCGMAVAPDYIKRFRYCHYLGKYFCSSCHNNALEVIPANVIRKWDFTKYEVSNFARDLLQKIHFDPLFDMKDLNPSLYKRSRVLEGLKDIRQQLHFFKTFMQTCRKATALAEAFTKLPDHICGEPSLYSMHDLLQGRDGDLLLFLRGLAIESLNHINQCQLCLAKGFICEYCKNGDDVIFPFQLNRVIQCSACRASFHKDCYVAGKCPKCERLRVRKMLSKEPVSPEEGDISGSWLR